MSQFNYDIVYRAGKVHNKVDTISKMNLEFTEDQKRMSEVYDFNDMFFDDTPQCRVVQRNQRYSRKQKKCNKVHIAKPLTSSFDCEQLSFDLIKNEQLLDKDLSAYIQFLQNDSLPGDDDLAREILLTADQYELVDGVLYRLWKPVANKSEIILQLVIPRKLVAGILEGMHDITLSAYLGFSKILTKILQRYY